MPSATVRPWGAAGHTRSAGLILVGLVHVAMVAALVEGFRRHAAPKPPPLTQVQMDVARTPPPPTPTVDVLPQPPLASITPRLVEVPDVSVVTPLVNPQPPSETVTPALAGNGVPGESAGAGVTGATGPGGTGSGTAAREPVAPGLVCTSMGAPDMPAVHWSGEAVFRAVAEVQAGRVVAVEIRALQGGMDARTRRALTASIETALRQHYVCPGNHRFQQDFGFRVD
ncbi:hypothetical protein [Roseateles terrae]|uniref:Ig-like domain-containing protein n=1 Tax=Roseateles terrae TaxID=431060 RepID=A0ABR6GQA4_9BURK|nr:hypothetical protein [Roseateles terrae]MBB3194303.1 hypothetical protein [Roseateles terrae]